MIAGLILMFGIGSVVAAMLFLNRGAEHRRGNRTVLLADMIDSRLPQTQCGECGYPGCRPYAEAIAAGVADINLCPPGGTETVNVIAGILGRNTANGLMPRPSDNYPVVARIEEQHCIGCFKCIRACPVDAILGAPGNMHTVMPKACTGCGLCIAPCPVDCIVLEPAETKIKKFVWNKPVDYLQETAVGPPAA